MNARIERLRSVRARARGERTQSLAARTGNRRRSLATINRNNWDRTHANHRYMTEKAVRDQMVAKGWIAEGDSSDLVVMCAPL